MDVHVSLSTRVNVGPIKVHTSRCVCVRVSVQIYTHSANIPGASPLCPGHSSDQDSASSVFMGLSPHVENDLSHSKQGWEVEPGKLGRLRGGGQGGQETSEPQPERCRE